MSNNNIQKPTERFTETVKDYVKYRPSYPVELINTLIAECNLKKDTIIADIGSGTGLLSKLFLDHGNRVYGVEPNEAMRIAAETYLNNYPDFCSIPGTAEATTLKNASVNMVTAGTAFHWFDAVKAKQEFKRILTAPGWVMLVWNVRDIAQSPLLHEYEQLISAYGKDYCKSNASKFEKTLVKEFFSPFTLQFKSFVNVQQFDWEGFKGRLLSSSYSLRPNDERYDEMLKALSIIFDKYQQNGLIEFLYDTKMYYGHLHPF